MCPFPAASRHEVDPPEHLHEFEAEIGHDLPSDGFGDRTLALLRDGYDFISKRCARLESDIFETRLLGQRTICMRGAVAARLFYDADRFEREGAAPQRLLATLFGRGGVQGLDGDAHRHRKALFMALMTRDSLARFEAISLAAWEAELHRWHGEVVVLDAVSELLGAIACRWAGVPSEQVDIGALTRDCRAMIDGAGGLGPRHWRGKVARQRTERWAADLVQRTRDGKLHPPPDTALHLVATHRDLAGELLSAQVAGVELINVLRPIIAIGRFVAFAALALHEHPDWRQRLTLSDDTDELEAFVQEVRRLAPFFPFVAARVRRDSTWRGYRLRKGTRVLLDLYGTHRDPRTWDDPLTFRPERFRSWNRNPFALIPQGGSDHHRQHRCPGEWITIASMKLAVRVLTRAIDYDIPNQDLRVSLRRIPAEPRSRFVVRNVRRTGAVAPGHSLVPADAG